MTIYFKTCHLNMNVYDFIAHVSQKQENKNQILGKKKYQEAFCEEKKHIAGKKQF